MMTNSMRTLFITKGIPFPPRGGVPLRNWQNINIMKQYGPVGVFCVERGKPESQKLPGVSLWHYYNIGKPLSRWEELQRRLWWVRPYAHPDFDCFYRHTAAYALDQVLTEFQPELVIFEQLWLYPYLRVVKRHRCRVIFDEHNVEADLFEQKHGTLKVRLPRLKAIELDFIHKSDQVWVCSETDADLLKNLYGKSCNSYVVPNGINVAEYDCVRLSQCQLPSEIEEKSHNINIILLGTFSYPPNQVAAQLLIEQIYPQLRQVYPHCRLLLVGSSPNQYILQAAKRESGIIVTGRVPDVRPYLATASVMVVPLLQGGGTRFKILEAFAAGCPVVSTSKGAEGLNATDGKHLLIRNGIEEIVEGVSQILSKPLLREKLTDSAYKLVKAEYSWEEVGRNVKKAVQEL